MSSEFDLKADDEHIRRGMAALGLEKEYDKIENGEEVDKELLNLSVLGDEPESEPHSEPLPPSPPPRPKAKHEVEHEHAPSPGESILIIDNNIYIIRESTLEYFVTAKSSTVPRNYRVAGRGQNIEMVKHIIAYLEGRRTYSFDEEPQLLKVSDIADLYDFTTAPESYHEICARNAKELGCPRMLDIIYHAFLQYLASTRKFPDEVRILKYFSREQLEFMQGFKVESAEPIHRRSYDEYDLKSLKVVSAGWPAGLKRIYTLAILYHCRVPRALWILYFDDPPMADSEFREACMELIKFLTESELVSFIKEHAGQDAAE